MIRKAVIPAAGLGTRFLPATKAQPKEMLPVVDKPVIQYVVEEAVSSGIKDILIITGKGKRAIEDHFGKSEIENEILDEIDEMMGSVNLLYTRQREPMGLGDAVYHAKSFAGKEPFALLLGDTITIPECTKELIRKYEKFKSPIIAVEGVPKEKISSYGIIKGKKIEGDTYLVEDLVEKPSLKDAPSNMGIIGRYILTPAIFDAIEKTPPGKGGEIQLTDALRLVGEKIYAYVYSGRRYDIGNKLDWIKSNIELSLLDERFEKDVKTFLHSLIEDKHGKYRTKKLKK
jgi:UTP--glucose-1-phosphate uridylyltransferase